MELTYASFGALEPGIYPMTWEEFKEKFGYNEYRAWLLEGLEWAIADLKKIGCKAIFVDGSFITKKILPGDFDLCWEEEGVDLVAASKICPGLFDCGRKMEKIKARYRGDVAPSESIADIKKDITFLGLFTEDRQGRAKGIIRISIC